MENHSSTVSRIGSVLLLVVAATTLFLAESSYWINHTIFNKDNFSQIVTEELTTPKSRDAIATAVVDRALEDRPLAQRALGDRAVALVAGLLDSNASRQAIDTVTTKTYAYLTSPDREDIAIDLSSVKAFLASLLALAESQGGGERIAAIDSQVPEEIVLVESASVPDVSGFVQTMLWLGPLFWLATIGSVAGYLYMHRQSYARAVYVVLGVAAGVAIFGLLTAPFIPSPLAAAVPNITLRPVVIGLSESFLAPFTMQMYYLLASTAAAALVFNRRFAILHAVQSVVSKISPKPSTNAKSDKKKRGL